MVLDDGVVDVLREPIAKGRADVSFRLASKIIGRREPAEVGHSLQVPHDNAWENAVDVCQTS